MSQLNGLFLDTETTGMNPDRDRVIEIALQKVQFDSQVADLVPVGEPYCALEDPGVPLSVTIQKITGIRNEDLKGHSIDWKKVDDWIASSDYIFAHHASFDRGFLDLRSLSSKKKVWICTSSQIRWRRFGFKNAKLEDLCRAVGVQHRAHRALGDVQGMLSLMKTRDAISGNSYFCELMKEALEPVVFIRLSGKTFPFREELKRVYFQWDQSTQSWGRWILKKDAQAKQEAWSAAFPGVRMESLEIPPHLRFSRTPMAALA